MMGKEEKVSDLLDFRRWSALNTVPYTPWNNAKVKGH